MILWEARASNKQSLSYAASLQEWRERSRGLEGIIALEKRNYRKTINPMPMEEERKLQD